MLKVWMPLCGNLKQQGISDILPTNGAGVTAATAGKIGQCMFFNGGSTAYIQLPMILSSSEDCSIAFWFKLNNNTANHCLFSCRQATNAAGFTIFYITGSGIRFDDGTSVQSTYNLNANEWYHCVCCRDSTTKYIYINGVLKGSGARSTAPSVNATTSYIGMSQNNASNTSFANYFNGYLNDYRIYTNQCLSAAEVKEIAQGLVLHYKLDTMRVSSGTNLVTGVTKGGQTTVLTDGRIGVQTSGVNADTYFRLNLSENITAGTSYLLSCDASGISEGQYWNFPVGAQSNSGTLNFKIVNGHNVYAFTANATKSDGTTMDWGTNQTLMLDDNYRGDALHPACFYNFELFKIGQNNTTIIVEDSSGYNHNGTIVGSAVPAADTARYNVSAHIDGAGVITAATPGADIRTLSCWVKTTKNKSTSQMLVADSASNMCISFYAGTIIGVFGATRSTGSKCTLGASYKENDWNHIVVVKTSDDGQRDIYCNGEKLTPAENDYWSATAGFFVGNRNGTVSGNTPFYGYISDVRAYCTPLLDTDIKQLYNVGMKVDKQGAVHPFELIENNTNLLFPVELSRTNLSFSNGLSRYTQANCQVTLTDQGYRIYRPPNLTTANDGNTMWGGLKLVNQSTDTVSPYNAARDNIWNLQTGHTYMIAFHVKGQSTNAASIDINHNMGNGVSNGVQPTETAIKSKGISANFQGEEDCYYIFTINDDIVKTSNKTSAGYQSGSDYLSYRHFTFGFSYTSTGALGTDLYLTNFRLYDITAAIAKITKQGQAKFDNFVEQLSKTQVRRNSELLSSQFIER